MGFKVRLKQTAFFYTGEKTETRDASVDFSCNDISSLMALIGQLVVKADDAVTITVRKEAEDE